jgi:probable F420-dependent oxidoreductase
VTGTHEWREPAAGIRFGATPGHLASPEDVTGAATFLEEAGYDGLYLPDHAGAAWHDPLTLLTWAAAQTKRLRLGTLVLAAPFRNPVMLCRSVMALNALSHGRFVLGLGAGWMEGGFAALGLGAGKLRARMRLLQETIDVLRLFERGEPFTFDGPSGQFAGVEPGSNGTIPLLVGGGGPRLIALAARHADRFAPMSRLTGAGTTPEFFAEMERSAVVGKLRLLSEEAERNGRDPGAIDAIATINYLALAANEREAERLRTELASGLGAPREVVADSPHMLVGTPAFLRERITQDAEQFGFREWIIVGGRRGTVVVGRAALHAFAAEVIPAVRGWRRDS